MRKLTSFFLTLTAVVFLLSSCANDIGIVEPNINADSDLTSESGTPDGLLISFTGNPAYDITLLNNYWAKNGMPSSATKGTAISTEEDIANIVDELIDRYGNMPTEVENLLEIVRIKELCRKANIVKLSKKNSGFVFYFDSSKFDFSVVDSLIKEYGNRIRFSPGVKPMITLKIANNSEEMILDEVKRYLKIKV